LLSERVSETFEPFPTHFLFSHEIRSKRGYIDNVKKAREKGKLAENTREKNKDIKTLRAILTGLPSLQSIVGQKTEDSLL
jgi:hypothetical protein